MGSYRLSASTMLTILPETFHFFVLLCFEHSHSVVKLGSPNLNFLIIAGAVLLYMAMFFFSISVQSLSKQLEETILCNVSILESSKPID